ncbi:MAG: energy-coupling factor transporter ATPase [Clostridia bacterium]|jgi:energy-coupling factor transport system ATP-binding protein|nr:energy-coupling factor transporter ATPase [Clostridia bacterium]MDD4145738.1 energy-coupling factor transporter ATPase [Clostridia bacterium]MDD4665278.1 energy-coupling factor transporter ATPase [Clostridia bacterium]
MPIILENVAHLYQPGSSYEVKALQEINLVIKEGEFVGLIGHTGSGKSTLVQHLNGLLKPTKGKVIVDDCQISAKKVNLKEIRKKVGLVFQYPEHQLFEETVFEDIAFGPKNLGLPPEQIEKRVKKALEMVHLDYEKYQAASPFLLSGGEKRRVAIAGVLAMEPKYLILDEPTAGLDPRGRDEILEQIKELHQQGMTVVLVSHSMDDVARLTQRLVVMHRNTIVFDEETRKVFSHYESLQEMGLDIPTVTKLMFRLKGKGWLVRQDVLTVEEAKKEILQVLKEARNHA